MTIDEKNYKKILTEKQQNYRHYSLVNLINIDILQVKIYYILIKVKR